MEDNEYKVPGSDMRMMGDDNETRVRRAYYLTVELGKITQIGGC